MHLIRNIVCLRLKRCRQIQNFVKKALVSGICVIIYSSYHSVNLRKLFWSNAKTNNLKIDTMSRFHCVTVIISCIYFFRPSKYHGYLLHVAMSEYDWFRDGNHFTSEGRCELFGDMYRNRQIERERRHKSSSGTKMESALCIEPNSCVCICPSRPAMQ